jgi:glycosyltransferase involved in cell wall biosynthesis
VVTVHDLAWQRWPQFFTRRGVRFFRRSLELTRRDATLVVCPSESTAVDAIEAGLDPAHIRIVPWGVAQERIDQSEVEATTARHGLARPYVMHCGTVEPRKNLGAVVDAFARLDRQDLDLVLVGPPGWRDAHPDIPHEVDERVRTLGFVTERDLAALYAGALVFCYPSLLEGFGLPVLEAMVQGTPVVTSQATATEDVLGAGGIAVDPRCPGDIAEALALVIDGRDVFSAAARTQASEYTWTNTAQRLAAVYREAAA